VQRLIVVKAAAFRALDRFVDSTTCPMEPAHRGPQLRTALSGRTEQRLA